MEGLAIESHINEFLEQIKSENTETPLNSESSNMEPNIIKDDDYGGLAEEVIRDFLNETEQIISWTQGKWTKFKGTFLSRCTYMKAWKP